MLFKLDFVNCIEFLKLFTYNSKFKMRNSQIQSLVTTIKERCKICYTCVRECPAKAIKIDGGQAQVISERCIGCGNCIKVCNQNAKLYFSSLEQVLDLIGSGSKIAVCLAPSFPAEFFDMNDYRKVIGILRAIGFTYVHEVAFGADLVALKYKEILKKMNHTPYISSDCPAIVSYIEKYFPHRIVNLMPVVSPMIASARVIRKIYGKDIKIVFIGPCIAKKTESDEIDAVLTFSELHTLMDILKICPDETSASDFDHPKGGKGAILALKRGLLQNVELKDSILEGNIIVAGGRISFQEAIKEFDAGLIKSESLELLCCEGCVMGVGMTRHGQLYAKRSAIRAYADQKIRQQNIEEWEKDINKYRDIDLSQSFKNDDRRIIIDSDEEIDKILFEMGKTKESDHLNCGSCGYDTCREHAIAIKKGLAENEMCLPFTIEKLHKYIDELAITNEKLTGVQIALKQSEKLASMGQLSATIAHELNNPLGVILMYARILLDECDQNSPIKSDLEKIVVQSTRCKSIVKNLLNFARSNQLSYEQVLLSELIESTLNSLLVPKNISIIKEPCDKVLYAVIDREQMIQSIGNLIKNAFEAMPDGGTLRIKLEHENDQVVFLISDTGTGISPEHLDQIFTPFFTTKSLGKGTGLGLASAYGIIKKHKGEITVQTNANPHLGPTGTTFRITLPKYGINRE
jgi:iron only hydrogenase large subunit-like protein/nitrogen-specific signal transduction histidine kinase